VHRGPEAAVVRRIGPDGHGVGVPRDYPRAEPTAKERIRRYVHQSAPDQVPVKPHLIDASPAPVPAANPARRPKQHPAVIISNKPDVRPRRPLTHLTAQVLK
jgi:hypothetical protein